MSVSTLGLLLTRGKRGSAAWLSSARAVKSRGECSLQDLTQHLMARARPSQYRLRRLRTRTLCVHQPGRSVYFVAFTGSPTFDQHEEVRCGLVQRVLARQPWSIRPPRPTGWPSTSFYADQLRGLLDRQRRHFPHVLLTPFRPRSTPSTPASPLGPSLLPTMWFM